MNGIKNVEKFKTIKVKFEDQNCAYLNYKEKEPKKYEVDIILNVEGYKKMWFAQTIVFPTEINKTLVRTDNVEQFEDDLVTWFSECVSEGFFSWDGLDELVLDDK